MSSFRFRIIISMLSVIFLILMGSYIVIQDIEAGIIQGEFRNMGFLLATNLASEISNNFLLSDRVELGKSVDNAKKGYPEIDYVFVTDSQGNVLAHTFANSFPNTLINFTKPENVKSEEILNTESGIIHEFDAPIKNSGYVHIGLSENRVNDQIHNASNKILLLAIGGMILGGIFVYFIGKRLSEPITQLTEGAKRINKGFLDQKITISSSDEMSELARTFNDMASSLSQKINEIMASKEKIEDAEKYLETLFDSIEDGIIVVNNDHRIIKMNSSFLKIIGKTKEEMLGKTCHETIFGSTQQKIDCPVNVLLRSGRPERSVHEVDIHNRKMILEINSSIFFYKKGTPNIILIIRDVTKHKVLENEIVLRNRELTALNDISKDISETFNLNTILFRSLENLLKLTGMESADAYLFDETKGDFTLRVHRGSEIGDDTFQLKKITEVLIVEGMESDQKGTDKNISFAIIPLRSKDKILGIITIRSMKIHIFSVRDKELFSAIGNQIGVAVENISFYENIKYLKEFNDEILNNIDLALHVVDRDMNILAVNNQMLKLGKSRVNREEILNKNLLKVYPFLHKKNIELEYEYVIKSGEIFQSEEKMQYYDEIIYTATSKIPLKDNDGKVEKIITVINDISDRKKLEEELKDSYEELKLTYSKLQELYKAKDNFLSNISHELRTPLTSVVGYTELLLDENLPEDQRRKVEVIFRNSKRLSRLIRELLDSHMIESSTLQLTKQTIMINDIVASVTEDLKNIATTKNIPIIINIPENLIINGDAERIMQVFMNIVENAIKFTIAGQITISGKREDEKIHIEINDTGIGIPEDRLDKIFERFYQVDSSNKRRYGGAGLGLWISKNIIEGHGGRIWAESKNSGSTFHILLPEQVKK